MNYYIEGDAANADQIKAAFESKAIYSNLNFANENYLYYSCDGTVALCFICGGLANIIKTHPDYKELELPVEPKFKVGDKIEATIYGIKRRVTIREVDKTNRCYFGTLEECIGFSEQDQWHLAPKKHYDIANFKAGMPVLVRETSLSAWQYVLFSHCYIGGNGLTRFNAGLVGFTQCIPFNDDTKHLLGTTDMCDEQYINW